MVRRTALLVAALAVVATVLVAAPANAAAYGVTLSVSTTKADVGTTVTLSGKVTGKSSTGRTVYLQRRSGSTWSTVTTTTTTSKSTYAKALKVAAVGANAYRAVVKATSSVDRGQSATRTVTGWTWLNLTDQPHLSTGRMFVGTTVRIQETAYPRSIETVAGNGEQHVRWQLDGRCDRSDVGVALNNSSLTSVTVFAETGEGGASVVALAGERRRLDVVSSSSQTLDYEVGSSAASNVLLATPRIHCSVSRLPEPSF